MANNNDWGQIIMDEKENQAVALKKFSLISPVLNGQEVSAADYFRRLSAEPIQMPGGIGTRRYSEKTFLTWLYEYRRYGFDALLQAPRSDKGKYRKINAEVGGHIIHTRKNNPSMPITVLYEKLVGEGIIDPLTISRSSVYRYVEDVNLAGAFTESTEEKELRRFAHEKVGELYQADLMYGPVIKDSGKRVRSYLHAFIDDCSRYPVWSQWYTAQNFDSLRHCFKEAVLRRGPPRMAYSDNGKIYRSQQFEFICASLGCTLIHSQPYVPNGRGKIERFFRTVRMRFLSTINEDDIDSTDMLNSMYFKWLEEDYIRKAHSGLGGLSPHDVLMSQIDNLKLPTDRDLIDEIFLHRVSRKVQPDATFQIDNVLYETDPCFSGKRMEIRYDPEWVGDENKKLPIYFDSKKSGEAWMVRFHDNAHAKRKFPGNRRKADAPPQSHDSVISYSEMTGGDGGV
jgi:transposase InsO family protein